MHFLLNSYINFLVEKGEIYHQMISDLVTVKEEICQ